MSPVQSRPGRKLLQHDRNLGVRFVAGADEVGRGCLAGPLVACAVVLDYERLVGPKAASLAFINDSKRLTGVQRQALCQIALDACTAYSLIVISAAGVDARGVHHANLRALRTAFARLRQRPDIALVDGFDPFVTKTGMSDHPRPAFPVQRIIKGDATSAAIAAASVIAKVHRDRAMERLDRFTGSIWAFADHAGYATPLHHERIVEHGISTFHRRSFASVAYEQAATARNLCDATALVPRRFATARRPPASKRVDDALYVDRSSVSSVGN